MVRSDRDAEESLMTAIKADRGPVIPGVSREEEHRVADVVRNVLDGTHLVVVREDDGIALIGQFTHPLRPVAVQVTADREGRCHVVLHLLQVFDY